MTTVNPISFRADAPAPEAEQKSSPHYLLGGGIGAVAGAATGYLTRGKIGAEELLAQKPDEFVKSIGEVKGEEKTAADAVETALKGQDKTIEKAKAEAIKPLGKKEEITVADFIQKQGFEKKITDVDTLETAINGMTTEKTTLEKASTEAADKAAGTKTAFDTAKTALEDAKKEKKTKELEKLKKAFDKAKAEDTKAQAATKEATDKLEKFTAKLKPMETALETAKTASDGKISKASLEAAAEKSAKSELLESVKAHMKTLEGKFPKAPVKYGKLAIFTLIGAAAGALIAKIIGGSSKEQEVA